MRRRLPRWRSVCCVVSGSGRRLSGGSLIAGHAVWRNEDRKPSLFLQEPSSVSALPWVQSIIIIISCCWCWFQTEVPTEAIARRIGVKRVWRDDGARCFCSFLVVLAMVFLDFPLSVIESKLRIVFFSTPCKRGGKQTTISNLRNMYLKKLYFFFQYFWKNLLDLNIWKVLRNCIMILTLKK